MVVLSEKHAVKLFEKSLSSVFFFAVCPYSCSRILVQSMVQVINKKKKSYLLVLLTSFLEFARVRVPEIFTLEPNLCLKVYDGNLGDCRHKI